MTTLEQTSATESVAVRAQRKARLEQRYAELEQGFTATQQRIAELERQIAIAQAEKTTQDALLNQLQGRIAELREFAQAEFGGEPAVPQAEVSAA
jgi:uncharacterized coiled-coil protein SlyX